MVASIPFVLSPGLPTEDSLSVQSIRDLLQLYGSRIWGEYGFTSGFNPEREWWSQEYIGIDQGITLLIDRELPHVVRVGSLHGTSGDETCGSAG